MNANELSSYVGRKGQWATAGMIQIDIEVVNAREAYGRLDLRVKPIAGAGEAWVDSKFVTLEAQ